MDSIWLLGLGGGERGGDLIMKEITTFFIQSMHPVKHL